MVNSIVFTKLVGGFNPSEKYLSKWESSPNRGENKKSLKPPSRSYWEFSQETLRTLLESDKSPVTGFGPRIATETPGRSQIYRIGSRVPTVQTFHQWLGIWFLYQGGIGGESSIPQLAGKIPLIYHLYIAF